MGDYFEQLRAVGADAVKVTTLSGRSVHLSHCPGDSTTVCGSNVDATGTPPADATVSCFRCRGWGTRHYVALG